MASAHQRKRVLLLNPNSSSVMTQAMVLAANATPVSHSLQIDTYTAPAPAAPASINDDTDIRASTDAVLSHLYGEQNHQLETTSVDRYDAVLVACFSVHSLVAQLSARHPGLAVTGIFEASVLTALSLVSGSVGEGKWGIVTTGHFWEGQLADGVGRLLGRDCAGEDRRFCGVFSTGLTAADFHTLSPDEVQGKLRAATVRLLAAGDVACVVMGCGGMAGLEDTIRSAARDAYGTQRAGSLYVVDAVKAGILQLRQVMDSRETFR
ncbi:hypothetical protein CDD83_2158 [Cordyceps sp. RAO-2017]|nr:hypothetical protein CDD83_2158 [Cordyceps sp. RAO-2017]